MLIQLIIDESNISYPTLKQHYRKDLLKEVNVKEHGGPLDSRFLKLNTWLDSASFIFVFTNTV